MNEVATNKSLARDALFRLNPRAPIIQANYKELFGFIHAVAQHHDPPIGYVS